MAHSRLPSSAGRRSCPTCSSPCCWRCRWSGLPASRGRLSAGLRAVDERREHPVLRRLPGRLRRPRQLSRRPGRPGLLELDAGRRPVHRRIGRPDAADRARAGADPEPADARAGLWRAIVILPWAISPYGAGHPVPVPRPGPDRARRPRSPHLLRQPGRRQPHDPALDRRGAGRRQRLEHGAAASPSSCSPTWRRSRRGSTTWRRSTA